MNKEIQKELLTPIDWEKIAFKLRNVICDILGDYEGEEMEKRLKHIQECLGRAERIYRREYKGQEGYDKIKKEYGEFMQDYIKKYESSV